MKDRYAKHCKALPIVVFVCRDESNAREFCRAADTVVTAVHAYAGEHAAEWAYPGRARMFFVPERELHEGSMGAYAVPDLLAWGNDIAPPGAKSPREVCAQASRRALARSIIRCTRNFGLAGAPGASL